MTELQPNGTTDSGSDSHNQLTASFLGRVRRFIDAWLHNCGSIGVLGRPALLLDLTHSRAPLGTDNVIACLDKCGIRPLIAHPERKKEIMRDVKKIGTLVQYSGMLQITAVSVIGAFGENAKQMVKLILRKDWAFVIATGPRNAERRPALVREVYRHIVSTWGEPYALTPYCMNLARLLALV
jgi:tyrosine-protein phosphatase YwqE